MIYLFEQVAKARGVKVSGLVRLLVLDEARRLGIAPTSTQTHKPAGLVDFQDRPILDGDKLKVVVHGPTTAQLKGSRIWVVDATVGYTRIMPIDGGDAHELTQQIAQNCEVQD